MYIGLLTVHSYLRWVVLVFALLAVFRAIAGWQGRGLFTPADDRAGRLFTITLDLQTLIGLILYVLVSPITQVAFQNFGSVMGDRILRFFTVEHMFGMVVAIALAHIGRAKTRRLTDATARHQAAALFFGLALLIMLASIPWPFLPAGRPWIR